MPRNLDDPAVAAKLIELIDHLIRDGDIGRAAKAAGLPRATAMRFLDSIKRDLASAAKAAVPRAKAKKRRSKSGGLSITAVSDGASRGNPGQASCAAILYDESGEELLRRSKRLGVATNNVAEYAGVILALDLAAQLGAGDLMLKLDS